ncbi:MAG: DUF2889 domain-containing protein [Syntrophomonadaceae bacterium]|nr:DUF2889 domain-containing protein [Syntrophomonadaceae bacterium]
MECLMQRIWQTAILRENEQYLIAETSYLDSRIERKAVMRVEINSLKTVEAWLERLGRPGDMLEKREYIEGLKGVPAYLGSGSQLKKGMQDIQDELERSLFNECVIGIVQAETFLFNERGYSSADEYSKSWEEFYAGSCRYYSHLDKINISWGDYIGPTGRALNLFNRAKSQQLMRDDKGQFIINGSLIDSFHQMSSHLVLDQDMKLISAHGQLLRAPDKVCFEAAVNMNNLIGQSLNGISKKELANLLGAGQGCVHLIDLVYDSVKTLQLYRA